MGIERFFNTVRKKTGYNVVRSALPREEGTHLFWDFNSCIHQVAACCTTDEEVVAGVLREVRKTKLQFPDCRNVYLAIDGVPSFGKMVEQRRRRVAGEVLRVAKNLVAKHYNVTPTPSFDRAKISPGTDFMERLQTALRAEGTWVLSGFDEPGEGEKKIVYALEATERGAGVRPVIISPDGDVVLLGLLLTNRFPSIRILRVTEEVFTVDLGEFRRILFQWLGLPDSEEVLRDVVVLWTVFGNDFVPRLREVDTSKNFHKILSVYRQAGGRLVLESGAVDWQVFARLVAGLLTMKRERPWRRSRGPAGEGYEGHLSDLERLSGPYLPPPAAKKEPSSAKRYCEGLQWIVNYYLYHDSSALTWYYEFEAPPSLGDLQAFLVQQKPPDSRPLTNAPPQPFLNPLQQLLYICPFDVAERLVTTLGENERRAAETYNRKFNPRFDQLVKMDGKKVNIHKVLSCSSASFFSKCYMPGQTPSYEEFLRRLAQVGMPA